jgi:hypothetical protein
MELKRLEEQLVFLHRPAACVELLTMKTGKVT